MALRQIRMLSSLRILGQVRNMSNGAGGLGSWGEGAGQGGGTGGSVREAGGSFGKMEAAHEEQYFRKLQAEQLAILKEHHRTEVEAHVNQIKDLEDEINRHKKALRDLKNSNP